MAEELRLWETSGEGSQQGRAFGSQGPRAQPAVGMLGLIPGTASVRKHMKHPNDKSAHVQT